ncbi:hypothetical protein KM043_007927 [Ampulex compressa]|nr:hypothetical protein KM043_007927 [Ampulex compressa]
MGIDVQGVKKPAGPEAQNRVETMAILIPIAPGHTLIAGICSPGYREGALAARHGKDGEACVLKAICKAANRSRTGLAKGTFLQEILHSVFTSSGKNPGMSSARRDRKRREDVEPGERMAVQSEITSQMEPAEMVREGPGYLGLDNAPNSSLNIFSEIWETLEAPRIGAAS